MKGVRGYLEDISVIYERDGLTWDRQFPPQHTHTLTQSCKTNGASEGHTGEVSQGPGGTSDYRNICSTCGWEGGGRGQEVCPTFILILFT